MPRHLLLHRLSIAIAAGSGVVAWEAMERVMASEQWELTSDLITAVAGGVVFLIAMFWDWNREIPMPTNKTDFDPYKGPKK